MENRKPARTQPGNEMNHLRLRVHLQSMLRQVMERKQKLGESVYNLKEPISLNVEDIITKLIDVIKSEIMLKYKTRDEKIN